MFDAVFQFNQSLQSAMRRPPLNLLWTSTLDELFTFEPTHWFFFWKVFANVIHLALVNSIQSIRSELDVIGSER